MSTVHECFRKEGSIGSRIVTLTFAPLMRAQWVEDVNYSEFGKTIIDHMA
ncbi:MAG: hypothetical protein JSV00_01520 [bacterium]|nr:MAG: hypothetical protein JSV00_01520 [bacterium]